jgi:IS30 family transposase
VTEDRLLTRFTKAARKETAKKLAAANFSTRQIAEITGADHSTIVKDLRGEKSPNSGEISPSATDK